MPSRTVDLNADLGEGAPNDEAILDLVTSASISCGAHAGDREAILRALAAALSRGVVLGAHPGFVDPQGFGRREMDMETGAVEQLIVGQVEFLLHVAAQLGAAIRFLKPHGALYNQAQRQDPIALGVTAAAKRLNLPVLGQPGSLLEVRAEYAGVRFIREGFPDRRYDADGRLLSRDHPDAILTERTEVEAQAVRLARLGVETLCIHGDDPRAAENAGAVREVLRREGIATRSFA